MLHHWYAKNNIKSHYCQYGLLGQQLWNTAGFEPKKMLWIADFLWGFSEARGAGASLFGCSPAKAGCAWDNPRVFPTFPQQCGEILSPPPLCSNPVSSNFFYPYPPSTRCQFLVNQMTEYVLQQPSVFSILIGGGTTWKIELILLQNLQAAYCRMR